MAMTKKYDPRRDGPKRPSPMPQRPAPRPPMPTPTPLPRPPMPGNPNKPLNNEQLMALRQRDQDQQNKPGKPQPRPKMPTLDPKTARGNAIMDRLK